MEKTIGILVDKFRGFNETISKLSEEEVVASIYTYLGENFGILSSQVLQKQIILLSTCQMIYELDGMLYLGKGLVGIIEVEAHVKKRTIHQLEKVAIAVAGVKGFNDPLLFVGCPLVDAGAKSYALQ